MQNKLSFIFQTLIICNGYILTNALIGEHGIENVTRGDYPAVVCFANVDRNRTVTQNVFCSGTFVTKFHIVSSQHCFDGIGNRTFQIYAEHPIVTQARQYFPLWWTTYDNWAVAHNIPITFIDNDVAMLRINGESGRRMEPSILSTISPPSLVYGLQAQVVGFGAPNRDPNAHMMQKANVQILAQQQCELQIYQATGEFVPINPRYFCTTAFPQILLTVGDSGGPLYYQGLFLAVNTATYSDKLPVNHPSRVNLHIGVEFYKNFINEHLRH